MPQLPAITDILPSDMPRNAAINPHGNFQKYTQARGLRRFFIRNFLHTVADIVRQTGATTMLDAGSGEGFASAFLLSTLPHLRTTCIDLDEEAMQRGKHMFPHLSFQKAALESLPFPDGSFDLALCLEVLEHQEDPRPAAQELRRVAKNHCIISVPHEPLFRIANFVQGKHVRRLGNHPEHCQQWNPAHFSNSSKKMASAWKSCDNHSRGWWRCAQYE